MKLAAILYVVDLKRKGEKIMKRSFLGIITGIIVSSTYGQTEPEIVWFPQQSWFDLIVQTGTNVHHLNDPDFPINSPDYNSGSSPNHAKGINNIPDWSLTIDQALVEAKARGVTHLELFFLGTSDDYTNTYQTTDPWYAWVRAGALWFERLENFNTGKSESDKIKLKIRIDVSPNRLFNIARRQVQGVLAPAGGYPNDVSVYSSFDEDGNRVPGRFQSDIGNSAVKNLVIEYTGHAIDRIQTIYPNTNLTEILLSTTGSGESGLWTNDGDTDYFAMISFSGMPIYNSNSSFREKVLFFKQRENIYHDLLVDFTSIIHSYGLKSAININPFQLVGGIFNYYDFLKGSGIDVITDGGSNQPEEDFLRMLSFNNTLSRKILGVEHGPVELTRSYGNTCSNWDPTCYNPIFPTYFRGHVSAILRNEGLGWNYVRWLPYDFTTPYTGSCGREPYCWEDIIGADTPNRDHLDEQGGILDPANTTPLSEPTIGIYINTLGLIEYEDEIRNVPNSTHGGNGLTYLSWFNDFGLNETQNPIIQYEKIEIITDDMIRDGVINFDALDAIYIPYEVSKVLDSRVYHKLVSLSGTNKAKIHWQKEADHSASGMGTTFNDWISQADFEVFVVNPLVETVYTPLLLN